MNAVNASSTGVSLKVAPLSLSKSIIIWHVSTSRNKNDPPVTITPVDSVTGGIDGGMVHNPDAQLSASIWFNAVRQSDGLKPLRGCEKSLPHCGFPKVKLPSGVFVPVAVGAVVFVVVAVVVVLCVVVGRRASASMVFADITRSTNG